MSDCHGILGYIIVGRKIYKQPQLHSMIKQAISTMICLLQVIILCIIVVYLTYLQLPCNKEYKNNFHVIDMLCVEHNYIRVQK